MSRPDQEDFRGTSRFLIQRRLGAGAFGVVYEAFDRERNATVALKTLRRNNVHALYGLKREFRALADIAHPNLVTLYELLMQDDEWFVSMELIRGVDFLSYVRAETPGQALPTTDSWSPTLPAGPVGPHEETWSFDQEEKQHSATAPLAKARPTGRLRLDRLRATLGQFAEGIFALHSAGKLHRDIKPSNVLVTGEGRVVLLDFGLVAELGPVGADDGLATAGTPTYMSPEAVAGLPVSEASDWYSFGVILYEALAGQRPFTGPWSEVAREKQQSEPAPPSHLAPGIPQDLDSLCRDLLARDPRMRPSGREILRRLGRPSENETRRVGASMSRRAAPFVGRQRHLALLDDAFRASRKGRTVSVSVHGSSGIGKTALIRDFLEELKRREDVVILAGRCYERESVPYKAMDSLVDALSQYLRSLPTDQTRALLPPDAAALARLFPVLARVESIRAASPPGILQIPDSHELRRRAFAALREVLSRLGAEKPLVLFIDDLQWGDADSAALLSELLRPPDSPVLLLIACYRSEDVQSSPLLRRLTALRASTGSAETREIVVGELAPSEARELVAARLGTAWSEAEAEAILRESGGNPFFIDELVESSREGSPVSQAEMTLEAVIHARVSRLPEDARRLLEVLCVAGQPVELAVARRAAYLLTNEPALPVLRSGRLIRTRGTEERSEIEVYHDRIREAVVSNLSPDALRDHHSRLAVAWEASGRGDPEALAHHFAEAGNRERAALYTAAAADRAAEALAFERAARLYRSALELGARRPRLSIQLAEALANAGRGAEAGEAYLESVEHARPGESLELRQRAAEQFLISGRIDQGLAVLRAVLSSLGLKVAETPRLALVSLLLRRARIRLRGLAFRERDPSEIAVADLIRIDACWSVAVGLGLVDPIRGNDFQGRNLLLALEAGEPYRIARALALEAGYSAVSGGPRHARTESLVRRATALAERIGNPHAVGLATLTAGIAAYLEGRWKVAHHLAERAEKILREECTGVSWERDNAHHYALRALFYLGDWSTLLGRLPALLKEAQERGDLYAETNLYLRHLCVARLAQDEVEKTREELARGISAWSHRGFHVQHYYEWSAHVEIALYEGNAQGAWELTAGGWEVFRQSLLDRVQFVRIESLHLRARAAVAAAAAGQGSSRRRLLKRAVRDCRRIEREAMPWGVALAHLVRAGIAATEGETSEALALAESAEEKLKAAEMKLHAAVARRCRGELLGGDMGRALVGEADVALCLHQIVRPAAIAAVLAPGQWRP